MVEHKLQNTLDIYFHDNLEIAVITKKKKKEIAQVKNNSLALQIKLPSSWKGVRKVYHQF